MILPLDGDAGHFPNGLGYSVRTGHGQATGDGNGNAKANGLAWCTIHDCAMDRYEKNGRSWYSHRIEGGKWCKGR